MAPISKRQRLCIGVGKQGAAEVMEKLTRVDWRGEGIECIGQIVGAHRRQLYDKTDMSSEQSHHLLAV